MEIVVLYEVNQVAIMDVFAVQLSGSPGDFMINWDSHGALSIQMRSAVNKETGRPVTFKHYAKAWTVERGMVDEA